MRVVLSLVSSFLGGAAVALMLSYPIPAKSLYVCFWAVLLGLVACTLGAFAIFDAIAQRERVRVDHVVDQVVAKMLRERGPRRVDD